MTTSIAFGACAARAALALASTVAIPGMASQIYITGFTTDNNIYTNLNEQFPNTGAGTPGSGVGAPDATYLYDPSTFTSPNSVAGSDLAANGINFELASDAAGQDFEQVTSGAPLLVSTSVSGATDVYLLTAAYFGASYDVTFTGTGGATETFSGISAPDFCNGGSLNSASAAFGDQSVLEVKDTGACATGNSSTGYNANYYLYEQSFALNSSFSGQSLTGISISNPDNTLLVLGITASATPQTSAVPEPHGLALLGIALTGFGLYRRYRGWTV